MGYVTFNKIVDHVFPIRKNLIHEYNDGMRISLFDFPNYGGLPKQIANNLSPEAVDAMQYVLQDDFDRKHDFARAYKIRMEEIGERLR